MDELIDLLYPTFWIIAYSNYKEDVMEPAALVKNRLTEAGCDLVEICKTPGYPIVYGEKIIDLQFR